MTGPPRPGPTQGVSPTGGLGMPRPASPVALAAEKAGGETAVPNPAVDAAVQAMVNAAGLPLADQIAQYEAAYETLRETLASIDQS